MARKYNLIMDQGTTFSSSFLISQSDSGELVDFTGYTASAQMRKSFESNTSYAFSTAVSATGDVIITMAANATSLIPYGQYVYDVEVTSQTTVTRLVEGLILVTPQVTR